MAFVISTPRLTKTNSSASRVMVATARATSQRLRIALGYAQPGSTMETSILGLYTRRALTLMRVDGFGSCARLSGQGAHPLFWASGRVVPHARIKQHSKAAALPAIVARVSYRRGTKCSPSGFLMER
jgi:hypothetical protein